MPKKRKLPKKVLGMKLSKEVRKKGGALLAQANTPAGREMIAGALTMAAAAASAAAAKSRAKQSAHANDEAAPGKPGTDPQKIADAIGGAADMVLTRLFGAAKG